FRTDDESVNPLPWVLSASGVLLIAMHVPHFAADLAEDVGLFAVLSGVIAPIILSFGLVVAGVELERSILDRYQTRRVCAWTLIGAIFL
ncbi:hypothetical protein GZA00_22075, partial [Escherichia coli]|uniref:hypothetical protein n=1 Tax=Escherichia coli TaxID=562 RepID=UPI0015C41A8D